MCFQSVNSYCYWKDAIMKMSGDSCMMLGSGLVQHWECDEYEDGTVTNCITGQIVFLAGTVRIK